MSDDTSQPIKVFTYMKSRGVELTREEIARGTGLSRDQVRKTLKRFADTNVIVIHEDESGNGVPRYTLQPNAGITKYNGYDVVRLKLTPEEAEKSAEASAEKIRPIRESDIARQGENAKSFMYQQGYSQGYNDAMFHSHRDAYNAGRKVVIEGLLKLLKLDAKVLMS